MSIGFANIFEIFQKNFSKAFDKQMTACPLCHVGMPFEIAAAVIPVFRGCGVSVGGGSCSWCGARRTPGDGGTVGGGELAV